MAKIAMRSLFHLFLFLFRAIQDRPHQQTFCQKMATKKREREKKNKTGEPRKQRIETKEERSWRATAGTRP